jgi:hypothetical protein
MASTRLSLDRMGYRLRQFWHGLWAQVSAQEVEAALALLPPRARPLFLQLPEDAQRHSLNVLHTVQATGPVTPDLAVAALLHDVGKEAAAQAGVALTLWWRGPLVLLEAFAPGVLARLASADPAHGWRYRFYVHRAHPQIGAAWAAEAGCSPLACWLIAHHQEKQAQGSAQEQALLQALQQADHAN